MRIADRWKEYELLDAGCGYRLERWGTAILQRPDPQAIWQHEQKTNAWQSADAVYHRSEKGGGHWQYAKKLPQRWNMAYGDLKFVISPTGFKHTGLFPEQAVNWDAYRALITAAARPIKVLNLFGYTGGATLACLAAGAEVTHVDASRGMVSWARENAELSGLAQKPVRWLVDDCQKYVAREIRRESLYDAVIMDPPSYGRGPGGEVWKLEENLWPLLVQAVQVLSERPLFFIVNNYTSGIAPGVAGYMLQQLLCGRYGGRVHTDEIGLVATATGGLLPCGSSSIWLADGAEF